jgi:hypothetical protein
MPSKLFQPLEDAMKTKQPKMSNHWFYERTLAPKIAHIAELCERRGMAVSILVEVTPGDIRRHQIEAASVSLSMAVAQLAALHRDNLDQLVATVAHIMESNAIPHRSRLIQAMGLHPDPAQRGSAAIFEAAAPLTDASRDAENASSEVGQTLMEPGAADLA